MNAQQIRDEVEAAKIKAAERYNRDAGAGAFAALVEYAKSHNAVALADICRVASR